MTIVSVFLFYPSAAHPSVIFHIFRHAIIVGFIYLAMVIDPCVFTIFLAILSIIEYSRKCNKRSLAALHITITVGIWLSSPPSDLRPLRYVLLLLIRTSIPFMAILLDYHIIKKIGLTSRLTDLVFPFVLTGSVQLVSILDPMGIAFHPSSYCHDYPDFNFVPLRFGNASVLVFLISFLVVSTSRWRNTHVFPQVMFKFVFLVVPTLIFMVYFARLFWERNNQVYAFQGFSSSYSNCSSFINKLSSLNGVPHVVSVSKVEQKCTQEEEAIINAFTKASVVIIAHIRNDIHVFLNGTSTSFSIANDSIIRFGSQIGRFTVLVDRQFLKESVFTKYDSDIIVSLAGRKNDEMNDFPKKTAPVITQTTGANLFHISLDGSSFFCNSYGYFAFVERISESFMHTTKISLNQFSYSKIRYLSALIFSTIMPIPFLLLSFMPTHIIEKVSAFASFCLKIKD